MHRISLVILLFISLYASSQDCDSVEIEIGTFRGNSTRNYYGNQAPSNLNLIWKLELGSGKSKKFGAEKVWMGAGWTGQPLILKEPSGIYLIQGAYDYHLRKIDALSGKVIWKYKFDDIIKSTGTFWINYKEEKPENRYVIMQGSRFGFQNDWEQAVIPSYRAISYVTGKELWRMNVKQSYSYSRDVDGSSLVFDTLAYIGLENGFFTVFDPNPKRAFLQMGILQPKIIQETKLFQDSDVLMHDVNFVTESSPALLGNKICIAACSHIYFYNLAKKKIDWDLYVAADIDGSPVVTKDSCVLIAIEKQYIKGKGGVFKINASKSEKNAIEWFFPTENKKVGEWDGGIIGTPAVNMNYKSHDSIPDFAAFAALDGFLYVVDYMNVVPNKKVLGPDSVTYYSQPNLLFKYNIGPSISSPIITENKIIAAGYSGIFLFEYELRNGKFEIRLLEKKTGNFEASPVVYNKRIYISSRDGFMYCFGEKK